MRVVAFLEVVNKGKNSSSLMGKEFVRHSKTLRFYSDDVYIVNELLGE